MTARIQRDFEFVSGVYVENELFMTQFEVEVNFIVDSDSVREQNVALDRIKYFFIERLDSSIFINEADTENIEKFINADMKIIAIPEEPFDQIIGIMLLVKLNSITEGRLVATDIKLTSRMSDGVSYHHSLEESTGPFALKGWWEDSSPNTSSRVNKNKSKKILKMIKAETCWDELYLSWEPVGKFLQSDVVVVDFEPKVDK